MNISNIVFIANPFGFGPTGKLFPLIERFSQNKDLHLIFFGSEFSSQIIDNKDIEYHVVDERSVESIKSTLSEIENPIVISSLNRFAVQAANELGVPCYFVDGLTWLWKEIPEVYLESKEYFALNFIGVEEKIRSHKNTNIHKVGYILDHEKLQETGSRKNYILMHVGGIQNPLYESESDNYIRILAEILNSTPFENKVLVTGSKESLKLLETLVSSKGFEFKTLKKQDFQNAMRECKQYITTSGLTSTMEAFASRTPINFLLPANLSQYKIYHLLKEKGIANTSLEWSSLGYSEDVFGDRGEKEALEILDNMASEVIKSNKMGILIDQMKLMIQSVPAVKDQFDFIIQNGIKGADDIYKFIISE